MQRFPVQDIATESSAREHRLLARIGGVCALGGTVMFMASVAPHGDLPTHVSVEAGLQYMADHRSWYVVHLGMILAPLLWLGAFAALAGAVSSGAARAVGHLLVPCAVIGAMFSVFNMAVDGFVFKMVADAWAAASGVEQEELRLILETLLKLLNGPFRFEIMAWYGLTFMLAGLVVTLEPRFPKWLGLVAVVAGGAACLSGMVSLAGIALSVAGVPIPLDRLVFLMAMPLEALWMLPLGVHLWRRADRIRSAVPLAA